MDSVTIIVVAAVFTLVFAFSGFVLQLFGWLKVEPADVKKFLVIRGRALAWNAYLIFAIIFSLFIGFVLSFTISIMSFSIGVATLVIMLLWALLGAWAPAIQRLHNKRINSIVDIVYLCLVALMIVGFWIAQWPEWQKPTLVTSLLLILFVAYLVDRFIKKRKDSCMV